MTDMKKSLLLIWCMTSFFLAANSQLAPIQMIYDTTMAIDPDTANFNDSLLFRYAFRNNGNDTVNFTNVRMKQLINGDSTTLTTIPSLSINPQSISQTFNTYQLASTSLYSGGINIVVVWPDHPEINPQDSIMGTVFILDTITSRRQPFVANQVRLFPNPFSENLRIQTENLQDKITSLTIFDQQGRVIYYRRDLPELLSLRHLAAGLYYIRIGFEKHDALQYKLLKRD